MISKKMTKEEEVYEELRKAINVAPISAPRSPSTMKLLKFFFPTIEDAQIGKHLECVMVGGKAKTAQEIAEESGKDVHHVEKVLAGLVKRGVFAGERPDTPGVMEYSHIGTFGMSDFMGSLGKDDSVDPAGTEYRKVVNDYYDDGYLMEWGAPDYPMWRTLVVDQSVDAQSKVLPYEKVGEMIKQSDKIAVGYCNCRVRHRNCDHRLESCLLLGLSADLVIQLSKDIPGARPVREISKEEALEIMDACLKEGLVPSTMNNMDSKIYGMICMCCSCCCHIVGGYAKGITGWGNPRQTMKSNFEPRVDEEKCNKCGKCIEICPVNARWRHWPHKPDLSDDYVYFEETRCIGCGVCTHNCPRQAMTMVRVRDFVPEPDAFSQIQRVLKEAKH